MPHITPQAMSYEHLIQLNDPSHPLLELVTPEEVWRGLWTRAHDPVSFVLGLEACTILSRQEDGAQTVLQRQLDYGSFQVHDEVTLRHPTVITRVHASAQWPESSFTIRLEQHGTLDAGGELHPDLYLRFVYAWEEPHSDDPQQPTLLALRKQAYLRADMDTVVKIRQLAAEARQSGGTTH